MGKLIIHNAVTVNGAFEAPSPDAWFVLDDDSGDASLEQPCWRTRWCSDVRRMRALRPSGPCSLTIREWAASQAG